MRTTLAFALAVSMTAMGASAFAQDSKTLAAAPPAAAAPTPAAPPAPAAAKCENPNALGVARVVQIDTTGAPGFGFEHFKAYDFLRDKEVVLTFDDGPWPGNTERVLKALADQCTKAMFFTIGKHASWHPEILKKVAAAGHTIGSHTWSHKDLTPMTFEEGKAEIEKGIAAVSISLGNKPVDAFFRFPALRHPPELVKYLGTRNIGIFSTDFDSFDFKMRQARASGEVGDGQAREARQGHHPDARLPARDIRSGAGDSRPAQGRRLQSRAGGRQEPDRAREGIPRRGAKEIGGGLEDARPMSSVIKDITVGN